MTANDLPAPVPPALPEPTPESSPNSGPSSGPTHEPPRVPAFLANSPPWVQRLWPYWPVAVAVLLALAIAFLTTGEWWFVPPPSADSAAQGEPVIYACPMHPHIQSTDPKATCPECGMALEVVKNDSVIGPHMAGMIGLKTASVGRLPLERHLRLFGRIELNQARTSHIAAWAAGRIAHMNADTVGMFVREGDHVMSLYSPQLFAAQEEYLANRRAANQAGVMQAELSRIADIARKRLELYGLTAEQIAHIEANGPQTELVIFAPQGGVIVERHVTTGQYVGEGALLLTIADMNSLWLDLAVPETDLPLIRQNQAVTITTDANPGYVVTGWVDFVEPFVNPKTRTAKVRVTLPNPILDPAISPMPGAPQARRFSPGMFATAVIHAPITDTGHTMPGAVRGEFFCPMHPDVRASKAGDCPKCGMPLEHVALPPSVIAPAATPDVLALPAAAILDSGTRAIVYVQTSHTDDGRTFELREVVVGPHARRANAPDDATVYRPILDGLNAGDIVATNGNFLLDSQAQIKGQPSLYFPNGQQSGSPSGSESQAAGHQH